MALRPEWRPELLEWAQQPSKMETHTRLDYLCSVSVELASSKKAFTWLGMPEGRFEGQSPGFRQWLKENKTHSGFS